jgi:hypothetical protein
MTTIPVVIETPGAHRERRATWALTLERDVDALGGRLEIPRRP